MVECENIHETLIVDFMSFSNSFIAYKKLCVSNLDLQSLGYQCQCNGKSLPNDCCYYQLNTFSRQFSLMAFANKSECDDIIAQIKHHSILHHHFSDNNVILFKVNSYYNYFIIYFSLLLVIH